MDAFADYKIDSKSDIPIWVQLRQRLVYCIVSGVYKPGDQLPTVRELALHLDVHYHTVNKVYRDLESSGLIEIRAGRGSYVSDLKESDFFAFSGDVRMAVAEYAEKLLALGMTSEEIVRAFADHLKVEINPSKVSSTTNEEQIHRAG